MAKPLSIDLSKVRMNFCNSMDLFVKLIFNKFVSINVKNFREVKIDE
jgi:hypothetical protein